MTHEATLIAVNVLVLQEALQQYDDWNSNKNNIKIVEVTKLARDLIKAKQNKKFNEAWNKMSSVLITLELDRKIEEFIYSSNKKNCLL